MSHLGTTRTEGARVGIPSCETGMEDFIAMAHLASWKRGEREATIGKETLNFQVVKVHLRWRVDFK